MIVLSVGLMLIFFSSRLTPLCFWSYHVWSHHRHLDSLSFGCRQLPYRIGLYRNVHLPVILQNRTNVWSNIHLFRPSIENYMEIKTRISNRAKSVEYMPEILRSSKVSVACIHMHVSLVTVEAGGLCKCLLQNNDFICNPCLALRDGVILHTSLLLHSLR